MAPTAQAEQDYDAIKAARMFTVGGVGVAGTRTSEELAFRQLLKQSEPVAHCKKLLEEGTPAGQMYGLLGLRLLDQKAFQAALPHYKDNETAVSTASGCIVMNETTAQLASQIEQGQFK